MKKIQSVLIIALSAWLISVYIDNESPIIVIPALLILGFGFYFIFESLEDD